MNKSIKRTLLSIVFFGALPFLIACGGTTKLGESKVDHPVVAGVTVATVQPQTVPNYLEAIGTVKSANVSVISAKLMGVVLEVKVKEGDLVHAGQLLMRLDDRDVAAQFSKAKAGNAEVNQALAEVEQGIRAAEANRQLATATYNRFKDLYDKKSVSRQEFDEVEAKYKGADAMYQSMLAKREQVAAKQRQVYADSTAAQTFVSYTRITAPQDGIVTQKNVDVGTMAAPGMPLIIVEDTHRYRLEASVGEAAAGGVKVGDEVLVSLAALGIPPAKAKISEVVPAADPMTRTSLVKIDLPTNPTLRSGLYGTAHIPRGTKVGMFLPSGVVLQRGELEYVWVMNSDGMAQMRLVKNIPASDGKIEIVSGLMAGERVVVEGADRVVDGAKLQ